MSYLSDRKRTTTTPTYISEIGICGGTSSMAAVRAKQMARQREISSSSARRMRSEDYLRNLYEEEEREKEEDKGRARAKTTLLEEQRIERLAARADRVRLRTDDPLLYAEKKSIDQLNGNSETPYSVLKARRLEEQSRRRSNDAREQVSKDLERARSLLYEERKRDNLEIARDLAKYGTTTSQRSRMREERNRRELPTSIMKSTNRRLLDNDDDYSIGRLRLGDDYGRTNGIQRDFGSTSKSLANGISRPSKEVHWSSFD